MRDDDNNKKNPKTKNLSPDSSSGSNSSLSKSYLDSRSDFCHCCEGIRTYTPVCIANNPSLSSLKYTIGTHGMFKASMISKLSIAGKLSKLTTREDNDLAIAIIDAWACIADVITFYQERIINEAFLRTATERMSVLELARSVGYELGPGVASDTLLAFKLEENNPNIEKTTIEKGTKIQSIPQQGEMPQIYETIETIEARPELNEIHANIKIPHFVDKNTNILYFEGLETELKQEDGILIISENSKQISQYFAKVLDVRENDELNVTIANIQVIWDSVFFKGKTKTISNQNAGAVTKMDTGMGTLDSFISNRKNFSSGGSKQGLRESRIKVGSNILRNEISVSQLTSMAVSMDVDERVLVEELNKAAEEDSNNIAPQVYAFRQKASIFGHDAPSYEVLTFPLDAKAKGLSNWDYAKLPIYKKVNIKSKNNNENNPENFVNYNSATPKEPIIFLDNIYENIITTDDGEQSNTQNWVVFSGENRDLNNGVMVFASQAAGTIEESLTEYAVNGRVTGIKLNKLDTDDLKELSNFRRRNTTAFIQGQKLQLADRIDETPVEGNIIELEKGVVGLHRGQVVIVTGEILDETAKSTGNNGTEYRKLLEGTTKKIIFDRGLDNRYLRESVKIYANIAKASHGETKREVLGSGDPSLLQQSFSLKQKPLTYVKAPTPTGGATTLEVRVDDILWKQVNHLYDTQPNDRVFVTRNEDDGGTVIIFGDGKRGSRPTYGIENINAKYRVGTGIEGLVKQNQLSLLMDRPLGVISVTNPFPTTTAEDPENLENARANAPLKVLTMDRIVSKSDFEHFARSFGGIGKALSTEIWDGTKTIVLLSLASSTGKKLDPLTTENINKSIQKYRDPQIPFKLDSFIMKTFSITAKIKINKDFLQEKILISIKNTILDVFSFEKRQFGQPVTLSEVVTLIQNVDGVLSVDVDTLHVDEIAKEILAESSVQVSENQQETEQIKLQAYLPSSLPFYDNSLKKIISAELLIVNPQGIDLRIVD